MRLRASEICGWVGLALIHGATLPATATRLITGQGDLPPLSMVVMVWGGLACFLVKAIKDKDTLYIASNGIGFTMQSLVLTLIVFGD